MPFAAAIFDLDGTLLDTERLVIEAGLEAFAEFGESGIDRAFLSSLAGVSGAEGRARVTERLGDRVPFAEIDRRWSDGIERRYRAGIPLMPGVVDLLGALAHLPRAVATNSLTASATRKLSDTGIDHHFAHVVGYDIVARPKPAPDVFLEAAARLGANPARCIAFEDSPTGVVAARAAGMTVVHVPDQHGKSSPEAHHSARTLMDGARAAGLI